MKVLITGSHGFLGSAFLEYLERKGVAYVAYDRAHPDIPDDVDAVVHFAGLTPLSEAGGPRVSFRTANVKGTEVLLKALESAHIRRFVNIGTAAEYGVSPRRITETTPARPVSDYGRSKYEQSKLIEAFAKRTGVKTLNLRVFNIAALPPRRSRSGLHPTIFESLMGFFTSGARRPLVVSHARSARDYLDVDDCLDAIWRALETKKGGIYEIINIGSGTGTSIAQLAAIFGTFFNKPYVLKNRAGRADTSVCDPSKAERLLSWKPRVPLEESLRKLIGAKHRVLIVGAGVAGREVVKEVGREGRSDIIPIGFVDDDPKKRGKSPAGLSVLGSIKDLPRLVKKHEADQVLISVPSASSALVQRVVTLLPRGFSIKVLPSASSILLRKVDLSYIRDIDVSDLAGRPLVKADQTEIAKRAKGRSFLITGGAGSIGSEIVRQLYATGAKRVSVLDSWEEGIFNLSEELTTQGNEKRPALQLFLGNIRDTERIDEVFRLSRPDVVIHAAAYKHIHLLEENQDEARKTNFIGTKNMLNACVRYRVKDFVFISTDKAVRPSSALGRTKRKAELLVKQYAQEHPSARFMSVRFGNVLNSSGSVVPTFIRQIRERRPVTITHRDMTRYFMAIPEAVSLVLLSWVVGRNGQILLLDMGTPSRILDLAIRLIKMHGLEPYTDIPIREIGVRPGEKIHEELAYDTTKLTPSRARRVFIAEDLAS